MSGSSQGGQKARSTVTWRHEATGGLEQDGSAGHKGKCNPWCQHGQQAAELLQGGQEPCRRRSNCLAGVSRQTEKGVPQRWEKEASSDGRTTILLHSFTIATA